MAVDIDCCDCGACLNRVTALIRGHVYAFEFFTWGQFVSQLVRFRDMPEIDLTDADCFTLGYKLGQAMSLRYRAGRSHKCVALNQ